MIATHSLPADTADRVARLIERLASFPRLGRRLGSGFGESRFVLGPWRWMVLVYGWNEDAEVVEVEAILDARSAPGLEGSR